MNPSLEKRLFSPGPKRILALDGGGIRGAVTLGFLCHLESLLQDRHQDPDFRLRDYFDLIGGTSTGSIIAAAIALGRSAEEIKASYFDMGDDIFEKRARWYQVIRGVRQTFFYRNRPSPIEGILKRYYGEDTTLGTDKITCGLVLVSKRADRNKVWPFNNNPKNKYYPDNSKIPLWRIVRASSAAPTFFPPAILDYGNGTGAFIDGGVSIYNNPALLLFFMTQIPGYHFNWKKGEENIMVVSIGTGRSEIKHDMDGILNLGKQNAIFWGRKVPDLFIRDASNFSEMMLQYLSQSPTSRELNQEIGNLEQEVFTEKPALQYLRYNAVIDEEMLRRLRTFSHIDPVKFPHLPDVDALMRMDASENVQHLYLMGEIAAREQLTEENFEAHFPRSFDVKRGN